MSAPNRLILNVGKTKASGFILPTVTPVNAANVVCKVCAPNKTKMSFLAEVIVPHKADDVHFYVFRCGQCQREWVTTFTTTAGEVAIE